jgi:hypothetical protein
MNRSDEEDIEMSEDGMEDTKATSIRLGVIPTQTLRKTILTVTLLP